MDTIINWMGGWPKEGLVAAADWEERLASAAERYRREAMLSPSRPLPGDELKALLARGLLHVKTEGRPERLRLGAGADAVLARLADLSLQPGDTVLTEPLTARSALLTFRKRRIRVEAVAGEGRGMDPGELRAAIAKHRPKAVYASPVCADPVGLNWRKDRLDAAVRICQETGVCLIRDDRQEMLAYEETEAPVEPVPAGVISIGQLPPGLVAGLRFGWAAGDAAMLDRWIPSGLEVPGMDDTGLNPLEKAALSGLLEDQPLEPLIDMLRVQCRAKMRRLTELLKLRESPALRWQEPEGGTHLWLTLPEGLDGEAMLRAAWLKGFMFQPGAPFFASRPQRNTIRLTFSHADERQLKTGVSRLFATMEEFLGRYASE